MGVVGAGQLALMLAQAAPELNIELSVLAQCDKDPAISLSAKAYVGSPHDLGTLRTFAAQCDVVTFDHELVDLEVLTQLASDNVLLRPDSDALRWSVDKAFQRQRAVELGLPVPAHVVVRGARDAREFVSSLEDPPVIKRARGGYDGRGVAVSESVSDAMQLVDEWGAQGEVVVEERVALVAEAAQIVVSGLEGERAIYPVVRTIQRDGMCVETQFPSEFSDSIVDECTRLTGVIADAVGAVGIVAVEYFITAEGPLLNEVALRPHNTGHWTIEGTKTSQFAQHLRAVTGRRLGATDALFPAAVMVNLVGGPEPSDLARARAVAGVAVHDYAKSWRPGRKLGHVTATGSDLESVHVRAWKAARAFGSTGGATELTR